MKLIVRSSCCIVAVTLLLCLTGHPFAADKAPEPAEKQEPSKLSKAHIDAVNGGAM